MIPVRTEKSDWERVGLPVSPVTLAVGTGTGCVSDSSDEMSDRVKVEGWADLLPAEKAGRDASVDLVKNERRSLAGKNVGGDVAATTLGAAAVTVCKAKINKIK